MTDVVVVGGRIARVSAAAYRSADCEVVLVESESAPAYHAAGRSAAPYYPGYGASSSAFVLETPLNKWFIRPECGSRFVAVTRRGTPMRRHATVLSGAHDDGSKLRLRLTPPISPKPNR